MNTNENDSATEEIRRIVQEGLERTRSGATTSLYQRTQGLLQSVTEELQTRLSSTKVPSMSDQPYTSSATPGNSSDSGANFQYLGFTKREKENKRGNPAIPINLNPTRNLAHLIISKHFMLICVQKILK